MFVGIFKKFNMRYLLYFLLLIYPRYVEAQLPFSLTIKTTKDFEADKFVITVLDKDQRKVLKKDSLTIKDGQLHYEGTMNEEVAFFSISVSKVKSKLSKIIIINSGENNLVLSNTTIPIAGYAPLNITGNKGIAVLDSLHQIRDKYYDKFSIAEGGARVLTKEGIVELNEKKMDYLKKYPDDYFSALLLYELSLYNFRKDYQSYVKNTYDSFSAIVKKSDIGKVLSNNITNYFLVNKNTLAEKKVPFFSIEKYDGSIFKNETLNGDTYLIVFSATWCTPCQQELPILKNIYKKYSSKGLQVVYFNEDDDIIKWALHIKTNDLASWINVSEKKKARDGLISKKFGVYSVPAYFLIDKNANIVYNSNIDQERRLNKLAKAIDKAYSK